MDDTYAPHIAEIKKALGDRVSEEVIIADLEKLVKYRVPVAEAKRSIIKKYGGTDSVKKTLSEITTEDRDVEITVKVLEVTKRCVEIKGVSRTILTGIVADNTAQLPFTAWSELDLTKGEVVNLRGAYVRSWQNQIQINIGDRCDITKQDKAVRIKAEIMPTKLADVKEHANNLHILSVILETDEQTVHTKEGDKTIISGILADDTAKLPFTSWVQNPNLTADATVYIENAYAKVFRGVPTINISEQTTISPSEKIITPVAKAAQQSVYDLLKREGAIDIIIKGNILCVRPGSGLIMRCPECKRVIQQNICRVHGPVAPVPDMRVKSVIDDGTGSLTLILDARLTEELLGYSIEEAKKMASDAISSEVVEENIREQFVGKMIAVNGNMSNGEYGAILLAESAWFPVSDLKEEAIALLKGRSVW